MMLGFIAILVCMVASVKYLLDGDSDLVTIYSVVGVSLTILLLMQRHHAKRGAIS